MVSGVICGVSHHLSTNERPVSADIDQCGVRVSRIHKRCLAQCGRTQDTEGNLGSLCLTLARITLDKNHSIASRDGVIGFDKTNT